MKWFAASKVNQWKTPGPVLNEKVTKFGKAVNKKIYITQFITYLFNETNSKINKTNSKQIFQTV